MTVPKEQKELRAVALIREMAKESLDPENRENLTRALTCLCSARKIDTSLLTLSVDADEHLRISYGKDMLGYIDEEGTCYFLSVREQVEARRRWVRAGCKVDRSPIKWHGRLYVVTTGGVLSSIGANGDLASSTDIYAFCDCSAFKDCLDWNLLKIPDVGKVMLA